MKPRVVLGVACSRLYKWMPSQRNSLACSYKFVIPTEILTLFIFPVFTKPEYHTLSHLLVSTFFANIKLLPGAGQLQRSINAMKLLSGLMLQIALVFCSPLTAPAPYETPHLCGKRQRETQEQYDMNTQAYKEQGLCRAYANLDNNGKGIATCETRCKQLAHLAHLENDIGSVTCDRRAKHTTIQ